MSEIVDRSETFEAAFERSGVAPEYRTPELYHVIRLTAYDTANTELIGQLWALPKKVVDLQGERYNMRPNGAIYEESASVSESVELGDRVVVKAGAKLRGESSIEHGVTVGPDAEIEDSDIRQLSKIGERAQITDSLIGEQAVVGFGVRIRDSGIGPKNHIGSGSDIREAVTHSRVKVGDHVTIDSGSIIGSRSEIGGSSRLDEKVTIGEEVKIEEMVHIGQEVLVGHDSRILEQSSIKPGIFFAKTIKPNQIVYDRRKFKKARRGSSEFF